MRLSNVLVIILTGLVTQSCKIEMPSLVDLLKDFRPRPYNVSKSQALKAQSGFKDTLIIGDDRETAHGQNMRYIQKLWMRKRKERIL